MFGYKEQNARSLLMSTVRFETTFTFRRINYRTGKNALALSCTACGHSRHAFALHLVGGA
jgi:hypothetical protein